VSPGEAAHPAVTSISTYLGEQMPNCPFITISSVEFVVGSVSIIHVILTLLVSIDLPDYYYELPSKKTRG